MKWLFVLVGWLALSLMAHAEGALLKVPTREGVTTTVFWERAPDAKGTLLLFPGGSGGFGHVEGGRATGNNFLVRSAPLFLANGFNVAMFGRPDDASDLDYADRVTDWHLTDVQKVLERLKTLADGPVWLVGTSRGTVSATAAAIRLQGQIAGLVLSSSVVSRKKSGAVPGQDLAAIRVPVLVMHHARDACPVCRPAEVPAILRGLTHAPIKKLLMVDGGSGPTGEVCAALHWHGYIGMEQEAVDLITGWIRHPTE